MACCWHSEECAARLSVFGQTSTIESSETYRSVAGCTARANSLSAVCSLHQDVCLAVSFSGASAAMKIFFAVIIGSCGTVKRSHLRCTRSTRVHRLDIWRLFKKFLRVDDARDLRDTVATGNARLVDSLTRCHFPGPVKSAAVGAESAL